MLIDGIKCKVLDVFTHPITVPDCWVVGDNKLGDGHGEAKLYISDKDSMRDLFGSQGFSAPCFLTKKDLITYLDNVKNEYFTPTYDYKGKEKLPELWQKRYDTVQNGPEILEFDVVDHEKIAGPRGYVKPLPGKEEAYQLLREVALPLVSFINVMKINMEGKTMFYWKLFADFNAMGDPLVFKYGDKKVLDTADTKPKAQKTNKGKSQGRKGQDIYREKLLEECPFCPITMINDERLLNASHIKPWKVSSDKEKIDPKNGFMLSPLYDRLFDRGFITFLSDKRVQISNWLSPANQRKIGIENGEYIQMLPLDQERENYLVYHREHVFSG